MAVENVTDLKEMDDGILVGKLRAKIALSATYEIEQLSVALRKSVANEECQELVRGVTSRIKDLSTFVMAAIGDESHQTDDLYYNVYGEKYEPAKEEATV